MPFVAYLHGDFVLQISQPGVTKQGIFLDGLTHSREWLAGATVIGMVYYVSFCVHSNLGPLYVQNFPPNSPPGDLWNTTGRKQTLSLKSQI